jgi:predicted alpha/beta superfamily hydrolase
LASLDRPLATILDSERHVLRSNIVEDAYELAIWVPPEYESGSAPYPTLYVLDSPGFFGLAVPIVLGQIWDGMLPDMIVVGIGKQISSLDEWWPVRGRDYAPVPLSGSAGSGHANEFLDCLRGELIPYVDQHFRTDPSDRTLWGHSLGGAFVLHLLLQPGVTFQRCIATSPAVVLDGQQLVDVEEVAGAESLSTSALSVSVGSLDEDHLSHIEAVRDAVRLREDPDLRFNYCLIEGYGHISAAPGGFLTGIRSVFTQPSPVA